MHVTTTVATTPPCALTGFELAKALLAVPREELPGLLEEVRDLVPVRVNQALRDVFAGERQVRGVFGRIFPELSDEQLQVVDWEGEPGTLVVYGGPLSGKTSVAVARAVRKVLEDHSGEGRCLLLTSDWASAAVCEQLVRLSLEGPWAHLAERVDVMTYPTWAQMALREVFGEFAVVPHGHLDASELHDVIYSQFAFRDEEALLNKLEAEWGVLGSSEWMRRMKGLVENMCHDGHPERHLYQNIIEAVAHAILEQTGATSMELLSPTLLQAMGEQDPYGPQSMPCYLEVIVDDCDGLDFYDHLVLANLVPSCTSNLVLLSRAAESNWEDGGYEPPPHFPAPTDFEAFELAEEEIVLEDEILDCEPIERRFIGLPAAFLKARGNFR